MEGRVIWVSADQGYKYLWSKVITISITRRWGCQISRKKPYITLGMAPIDDYHFLNMLHTIAYISLTYPISTFAETTEEPGTTTAPALLIHHDGLPERTQQNCIGWRTKTDKVGQPIRVAPSNTIQ